MICLRIVSRSICYQGLLGLMLMFFFSACASQAVMQPTKANELVATLEEGSSTPPLDLQGVGDESVPTKQHACPDLESSLYHLTLSPEPLELARQLGIAIRGNTIQVSLTLAQEDTTFLQDFDVEIGSQRGSELQLFAPVDQLCDLANTPEVVAVRIPASAAPQ